jgi:MoxR-like ATPase
MDRFLMKLHLDYPSPTDEAAVLQLVRGEEVLVHGTAPLAQLLEQQAIFTARQEVGSIHVAPTIDRYLIDLVNGTRRPAELDPELGRWITVGASPRGGIALDRAARAHAWLNQQDFVSPDDVRAVLHPVLRHRMMLSYDAVADGVNADQVLDRLLDKVAIPA